MWAAVSANGALLSYDISDNATTVNRYKQVLNVEPSCIESSFDGSGNGSKAIFQQDGAAPHFANPA